MNYILEFQTQQEAQDCLDYINQTLAPSYWESLGYLIVIDDATGVKGVVGKNSQTQELAYDKEKTTSWGDVKRSPDNTYYIESFTGTPLEGGIQNLVDAGFVFIDKEKPQSWYPSIVY